MGDALLVQVLAAGGACKLLEQSGKMKLGETGLFCNLFKVYVFCAVVGDVVADHHEFFRVFLLFVSGDSRKFHSCVEIGSAQSAEKTNH